jgi:hypothetical protein
MAENSDGSVGVAAVQEPPRVAVDVIEALKADLLMVYKAVVALEKLVNESTVNMTEIKPQLIALKVHTESFPNALRELRRSQSATQKMISDFEARLRNVEARVKGSAATS